MISNITSLAKINFVGDIYNLNVTIVNIKDALSAQKDIILYTIPDRITDATRVDLLSKILFGNDIAISESSKEKHLQVLYKAEITTKNISESAEIALERIGDWVTYPNDELNRELVARFVELHYRSDELGAVKSALNSVMTYWPTITYAGEKLKDSLHLTNCYGSQSYAEEFIKYDAINQVTECLLIGDLLLDK